MGIKYHIKIKLISLTDHFHTLEADQMRAKLEFSPQMLLIREHMQLRGILTTLIFFFSEVVF